MKIVFLGDSITDAGRNREGGVKQSALGYGFVRIVADRLIGADPEKYTILNRGVIGNRIVDLYAGIKCRLWNEAPDLASILIGINDVWHEITARNGVDLQRYERVYRMIIEDTKARLPDTKLILCEPFVVEGTDTCPTEEAPDRYARFSEIKQYAATVKKLADEYGLYFLPLQEAFDRAVAAHGAACYAPDGVHPNVGGSSLIAGEWVKLFREQIEGDLR
ncbi:MAG: SGNH/GDSL hydrolase family protein [Clostridia bacterium]|nr:SGNH/GDSL hydrolase family protein [Clostridia bacterium]